MKNISTRGPTIAAAAALLASCRSAGIMDPRGPVSAAEWLILLNATGIMLVVVGPVIVMTFAFAWWYRASNKRAAYSPEWSYSGQIELVVWAVPAMVVILLAGVEWIGSHQLDPARKLQSSVKPVHIDVVSMDWQWLFIYPDQGVATVNQLVVPAGAPLEFTLTSATVMNAFFIPQLGSQIYTMPGMTTHLNLLAAHEGDYPGLSSHFSGDGFSDMHFVAHAVSAAEFAAWAERTRSLGTPLDAGAYADLLRPQIAPDPHSFSGLETGIFEHILQLAAPGAAMQAKLH
jgi:cytochrome o ubiquinol oxidase subunit 2